MGTCYYGLQAIPAQFNLLWLAFGVGDAGFEFTSCNAVPIGFGHAVYDLEPAIAATGHHPAFRQ